MTIGITKEQWVAALRSGQYRQTSGILCDLIEFDSGIELCHCCLGVLAEQDPDYERFKEKKAEYWHFRGKAEDTTTECELGDYARPEWMSAKQEAAAIHANDNMGWSFDQIADWVEAGMKVTTNCCQLNCPLGEECPNIFHMPS